MPPLNAEKECYTEDEYFEFERTSFGRWEYVKGEIRAMSGDTADPDVNTFPDVSVVCGPLGFHQGRTDIITNPLLVVEVLSDSTEILRPGR